MGWLGAAPRDRKATAAPAPTLARTRSPDFSGRQAPNYLRRFTFNLGASAPLHTNSTAPLLEITYHATDSIPGQNSGSEDENKLRMKISSKSAIAFWKARAIRFQSSLLRVAECSQAPFEGAKSLWRCYLPTPELAQGPQPRVPGLGYTRGQTYEYVK